MPIQYMWNPEGRLFQQLSTYQYPFHRHPNHTFIDKKHHEKITDLLINVCGANMNELCTRSLTVKECLEDKKDILLFRAIEKQHITLLDNLLDQMHQDMPSFLIPEVVEQKLFLSEAGKELMQAAFRASLEWHVLEPFMDAQAISNLRDQWILNPVDEIRLAMRNKKFTEHEITATVME